jgi:hypothetical protein
MKKCTKCKKIKSLDSFNKNKSRKDGLSNICRECSNAYCKQYYSENKEHHAKVTLARSKKQIAKNREFILEFLSENPCVDCGMKDPRALEFDHLSNKKMNISNMVGGGYCIASITREIKKCVVRCANCHNIKTAQERGYYTSI